MLVDIECEDGTTQIACIVHEDGDTCKVRFLERIRSNLYDFTKDGESIDKTSISGYYDTDDLVQTNLYVKVPGGYELIDDSEDEDFSVSESDDEESEDDVSLVDEEEEET
jgi:hypothetical protein